MFRLSISVFLLIAGLQFSLSQSEDYQISLDVTGFVESLTKRYFTRAVEKWSSAITGDVFDVSGISGDSPVCGEYPSDIDDLHICGRFMIIDLPGGVLGMAGPTLIRTNNSIPAAGIMLFDLFDLPGMWFTGRIDGVILHEMGHILGLGTNWETVGLTERNDANLCPYAINSAASREYQVLSGCADASVPVEYDGAEGTRCGHFDETCFKEEMMTGYASGKLPMSKVTIGSLEDLGYEVDYTAADEFSAADLDESCRCTESDDKNRALRTQKKTQRRRLSDAGVAAARQAGLEHLKKMKKDRENFEKSQVSARSELTFVGDKFVRVIYAEGNDIHDVMVSAED